MCFPTYGGRSSNHRRTPRPRSSRHVRRLLPEPAPADGSSSRARSGESRTTTAGIHVTFECWCGVEQAVISGRARRARPIAEPVAA